MSRKPVHRIRETSRRNLPPRTRRLGCVLSRHRTTFLGVSCYSSILFAIGIGTENSGTAAYAVSFSVVVASVVWIHWKAGLDDSSIRALALLGALHLAGGLLPVRGTILYHVWLIPPVLRYDGIVHMTGGAIAAVTLAKLILTRLCPAAGQPTMFIVIGMGMGLAGINEVIEFIAGAVFLTKPGDYWNTGWDLTLSLAGTCLGILWWKRSLRREKSSLSFS